MRTEARALAGVRAHTEPVPAWGTYSNISDPPDPLRCPLLREEARRREPDGPGKNVCSRRVPRAQLRWGGERSDHCPSVRPADGG